MDENNKLHYFRINGYSKEVQQIFNKYNRMFANLGLSVAYDKKKGMFYFRNYTEVKSKADNLIKQFAEDVTTAIKKGCSTEWEKSNLNNDILAQQILGKIWQEKRFAKYFQHNKNALNSFLKRKQNGLNLSKKVWNCSKQYMKDIEKCLSVGIDKGVSADTLAKLIKLYIENPNALDIEMRNTFSTTTTTNGGGQGVYRSAYKNAMRLTRTETNMAYRSADSERWKQMDFVLGYKVQLSGSHPAEDICDQLQGDYPTTFKFVGWHPHCLCFATAILQSKEDFFNNKTPKKITDLPQNFKDWYNDNYEKILSAQENGKLPYFIKDNFTADNNGVLQFNGKATSKSKILSPKEQAKIRHAKRTQKQIEDIKARWHKRLEKLYVPKQLWQGGKYLGDLEKYDIDFFRLLNPNKTIELRIDERSDNSYYNIEANMVFIGTKQRVHESDWFKKAVIYHEYGHAIDFQRWLNNTKELKDMMKRHSDLLLNTKVAVSRDSNGVPIKTISLAEYTENLAKANIDSLWGIIKQREKQGLSTKECKDAIEQYVSMRDTIKALTLIYGYGHSDEYFANPMSRATEYIAHAFENAFIGNKQFKKLLPEIYDDMVDYIRQLKKMQ